MNCIINPETVKNKLNSIISDISDRHWLFSSNPGHDFMRQNLGKLSMADTIRFILSMGKGTTSDELIDFFNMDADLIPSHSALIQRRNQISLSAFRFLFEEFSSAFPQITHKFKDFCILACDGCHVVYATNSDIIEDFNKPRLEDYKGYNHMHLNGFVDVISKAFLDVVIQPGQLPDERAALHSMLDHFDPDDPQKYIITADRGYESYDLIFHCLLKNLFFVFRVKSPSSPKSMLSSFKKEFKTIPHFYPLLDSCHLVYVAIRVLKIRTSDTTYEYIITNLPSSFSLEDIRECYHWRWGIEISFRYLKHAAGLLHFHSKKPEFLQQEIYASLVMYNFGVFLANEAADENRRKKHREKNKHIYEIDFSTAIRTARKFYIRRLTDKPVDIIRLLCRFVHAVKEKYRQFPRPLRGIGAIRFSYR